MLKQLLFFRYITLIILGLVFSACCSATNYQIGGMFTRYYHNGTYAPWGDDSLKAALLAVDEINRTKLLGSDTLSLSADNNADYHCWPDGVEQQTKRLIDNGVVAIVGADCSSPAVIISKVAAKQGIPVISYGSETDALTSRRKHPNFARTFSSVTQNTKFLVEISKYFDRKHSAVIYTTDELGSSARKALDQLAYKNGLLFLSHQNFKRDAPVKDIIKLLSTIKKTGAKLIFVAMPKPDTRRVFEAAAQIGFMGPDVQYIAYEPLVWSENKTMNKGANGYLTYEAKPEPTKHYLHYLHAYKQRYHKKPEPFAVLAFDSVFLVAHSILEAKKALGFDVKISLLLPYLHSVKFQGASGVISYLPNSNDREFISPMDIVNMQGVCAKTGKVRLVKVGGINMQGNLTLDNSMILRSGTTVKIYNDC